LSFNGGHSYLPQGIYFDTPQFSVSLWIYPISFLSLGTNDVQGPWSPILDFCNDHFSSRIVINMGDANNNFFPSLQVLEHPNAYYYHTWMSTLPITPNAWQLIVFTYDGVNVRWFINGTSAGSSTQPYTFSPVIRNSNLFGKDYASHKYIMAYVDDIRFFSISLGQSQINEIIHTDDTTLTYLTTTTSTTSTTTPTKPFMDAFLKHQWRFEANFADAVTRSGHDLMAAGQNANG